MIGNQNKFSHPTTNNAFRITETGLKPREKKL